MAFDTIQPNNGPVPPQEGGITMRDRLKSEMIHGAALVLLGFKKDDFEEEEEVAEESSPSLPPLPPLPFRPLRNDIEFHLREINKNEREKKIEENRKLLMLKMEVLKTFLNNKEKNVEEKDIIDALFFSSKMTPEERVKRFLVYCREKEEAEIIRKKLIEEAESTRMKSLEDVIISAAAILSGVRGDSAEEARKDIINMIGTDPVVRVEIDNILNKGNKSHRELGKELLEYLRERKKVINQG